MSILELPLRYTDVGDPGFTMLWAARIRNLREKPSPGVLGNALKWKAFNPTQPGCLAEGLVKRALALGPRGPGRLITEAGNELMSRPALRSVGFSWGKLKKAEQHT